ncbi:MAG: DNA alkylation repair protein [Clostridia bacterium]|nr:DNA alkylation repair protein [Clostridia bacterium]
MITYEEVLSRLKENSDGEYRAFHSKLLKNDSINLIGIRTPVLRKLAKEWKGETDTFLSFPDEYYEITFLKCALVGALKYEEFIKRVDKVVPLLDNWATCDTFDAPCVKKHREEFLPFIKRYLQSDKEFTVRYGLVMLLHYYVEEEYLPLIFESVRNLKKNDYYIMMGAAWLIAEVLVKYYEAGVRFLQEGSMPKVTHNKAIQKACESFRVTSEEKAFLKSLRKS